MARLYSVSLFPAYDSEFYSRKYRYDYNILILLGIGSLFCSCLPVFASNQDWIVKVSFPVLHYTYYVLHWPDW